MPNPLVTPGPGPLTDYDILLINSSGGKDSMTILRVVTQLAREQGVEDRIVVVHADLERADWDGTRELAEKQTECYGHRFIAIARPQGDLLDHVIDKNAVMRRKGQTNRDGSPAAAWPTQGNRWCTSDHKRGQIYKVLTMLVDELNIPPAVPGKKRPSRPAKILNIMGIRAEESKDRAKMKPFSFDEGGSRMTEAEWLAGKFGKRNVWKWYPIHHWTTEEVWEDIHANDVPYHWAYDAGMSRLSCCFCMLAGKPALLRAAQLNEVLADKWLDIENSVVGTFKQNLSMAQIIEEAKAHCGRPVEVPVWCD